MTNDMYQNQTICWVHSWAITVALFGASVLLDGVAMGTIFY